MIQRLQQLVDRFAEGRNTRFAQMLHTNEARIRSYLTGAVMPKYDFLSAVSQELGVSIDWLISGEGEMLRKDNAALERRLKAAESAEPSGLPVYESDFTCNFEEVENDQNCRPGYFMDTPLNRSADFWCSVQGKSMSPDIEPGDKIALRRCTWDNFEPGHIYAVVMDDLRTVKKLRRVPSDPTVLEFVATNPDYGIERYPVSRILHLYRVVGKLHSF
ncbi:S24 family peptidase [Alloprevotella sp. OH1205_COT-284]|uniref:S24 family peptidase n=1 Tax=Alloprevotella sp. OH1205_COT-284 TaxID=2491043 RepID=UPI00131515F8|nr:S24 family peptidase [Alloprevotella sp. OH1205_COT-284]